MRLVLVGWGAISRRVSELLPAGVTLVGVGLRPNSVAELPGGVARVDGPEGLAGLLPDLVIEAAGRAAVAPWGMAALAAGADFVPTSTSALTDASLMEQLVGAARAAGRQMIIPPGALGGIDALAAAAVLPLAEVRHEIIKPPAAWTGTEAERLCDLTNLTAPFAFFEGTADQAAARFPQNANVAAISALAGLGMARTTVALVADPGAVRNAHRLTVTGDFGRMTLHLENRPMATNPKTSELTALSLVRLVANRVNPMVI